MRRKATDTRQKMTRDEQNDSLVCIIIIDQQKKKKD